MHHAANEYSQGITRPRSPDGNYPTDAFTILPDESSIKVWLASKEKRVEAKGLEPRLFIRLHEEVLPKWVDLVLKQATDQDVGLEITTTTFAMIFAWDAAG